MKKHVAESAITERYGGDLSSLATPSCSPRDRMIALTATGCFRQWQPAQNEDGQYNDSAYLWWIVAEDIMDAWGFTGEECDQAWKDFLARHKGRYPGGNWQPVEKAFLDSLENKQLTTLAENKHAL